MNISETLKNKHHLKMNRKDTQDLIKSLFSLGLDKNWEEINNLFLIANKETSKYTLVCLLRITFYFRKEIKEWNPLLENSKKWLDAKGENTQAILDGL